MDCCYCEFVGIQFNVDYEAVPRNAFDSIDLHICFTGMCRLQALMQPRLRRPLPSFLLQRRIVADVAYHISLSFPFFLHLIHLVVRPFLL